MQVLLRLFNMEDKAADGSYIPRSSVEAYLASEDYKVRMRDHLSLGGVTHKDRKPDTKYEDIIAPDDQIMVSNNVTHYITKIYIKDNDPWCYCIIETLDADKYSGVRRDNILNLEADLKSGIMLPCSVVIQAMWTYDNEASEIMAIKGVDFTLGPSFKGSGTEKIFSIHKTTKCPGASEATLNFSATPELLGSRTYTKSEVAKLFGLNSTQYKSIKSLDENAKINDAMLGNADLNGRVPDGDNEFKEDYSPEFFDEQAEKELENYPEDYWDENEEKSFSNITQVRDRMYLAKYPRVTMVNRIIRGYQLYWSERSNTLSEYEKKVLSQLLNQDLSILIRNVSDEIKQGKRLSTLYALQQFSPEIVDAANQLSIAYRYVLLAEDQLGFIPEMKYMKWKQALTEFYISVDEYCFGGYNELPSVTINELN